MHPIDYFDVAVERYGDRLAVIDGRVSYTYRQLQTAVRRVAAAMRARGFQPQQRAALYSRSDPRALIAMLAIMQAGGVVVPLNGAESIAAGAALLRHVEPSWLFVNVGDPETIDELMTGVPSLHQAVPLRRHDSSRPSLLGWMLDHSLSTAPPDWSDRCGNENWVVSINQTSGTTGTAKAVELRAVAYAHYIDTYRQFLDRDDDYPVCLTASQMTPASLGMAMVMLTLGACHVVLDQFTVTALVNAIERCRVTHAWLPATALNALLAHPLPAGADFSSLRHVVIGGAAIAPQSLQRAVERLGPCIAHSYGQMETGVLSWLDRQTIALATAGTGSERLRSCGRVNASMRVGIMSPDGELLPPLQVGEIVARGRGVSAYYGSPGLTADTKSKGWHRTGDQGYLDADGFLYVVGRLKDTIVTGGCNVSPADVEAAIMELRDIEECAVVGVPDALLGEAVVAVVVAAPASPLTGERVSGHCRRQLGSAKSPRRVEFRPVLPKTAAGKIDKAAIRVALSTTPIHERL